MRITSSSISSSEPAPAPWRGFILGFAAATALVFGALALFVVGSDPYDRGQFALLRAEGVPAQAPRTAHASRGRDPAFDAAILGNSHIQLLSPAELTRLTGFPFVSLAVPGTGPRETFVLLDYVLRHRARPARALVLGIDPYWCRAEPEMPTLFPFPFWLYDRSAAAYLGGVIRYQSLEDALKRITYARSGGRKPRARPDGYWDYDEGVVWQPERHGPAFAKRASSSILNETGRFPAIEALATRLADLPPDLPVVLVRPPVHAMALAEPGSSLARSEAACLGALQERTKPLTNVAIVDWRVDRPEVRIDENFIDLTHYRSPLARAVERDVAAVISATRPPPSRPVQRP